MIKILFFAQAADAAGKREHRMPFDTGDSEALWSELLAAFPALAPLQSSIRLARNGSYAAADELFRQGDEIALIPPVSGG